MQKILGGMTLFLSFNNYGCELNQVSVLRTSSFGFSSHSDSFISYGAINHDVNIPFSLGNKRACFTQKSGLAIESEESSTANSGTIKIYPPKVKMKKVKGGVRTYLKIKKDPQFRILLDVVSVTCAEEAVLAIESFSGSVNDVRELAEFNQNVNHQFFAMGNVAQKFQNQIDARRLSLGYDSVMSTGLMNEIENIFSEDEFAEIENKVASLPAVFLYNKLGAGQVNLNSGFRTINISKFACTKEFDKKMNNFRLDRLKNQLKGTSFKYKKRRKYFKIYW